MLIGIPKEQKHHEYRVGATPGLVALLTAAGHKVLVQETAGLKAGYPDELYVQAGATMVPKLEQTYEAEMIVKVKAPQKSENPFLRKGQLLFCYLHLAADPDLLKHLIERKVVAIAYETVKDKIGRLPLLTPMSEVAGRMAVQAGAMALHIDCGGKGLLLGGIPGVTSAKIVILGGGIVGTQAAKMAIGYGADVTIIEKELSRLRDLDDLYGSRVKTLCSTPEAIQEELATADLVIGAVLIPGKKAPCLISEETIKTLSPGSVFVDVAIDQGGCSETSRPTTFSDPTYLVHNVVHYCVTNMPAACARTSTQALVNATTPYVLDLAEKGYEQAFTDDPAFQKGLSLLLGQEVCCA